MTAGTAAWHWARWLASAHRPVWQPGLDEAASSACDFPPLGLLVFVVGAASLGAEIAAARLMAPFFGASTIVWANTIGVVLVSLSIGYWLGGRFADRHPIAQGLRCWCWSPALALGLVPFVAGPFLTSAVEALDSVSAGAFVGSLIAVSVLVAPPVHAARRRCSVCHPAGGEDDRGERHGRGPAVRDLHGGRLAGTSLSALLLIPLVGTRRTFLVFGCCALVAVPGLARRRCAAAVPAAIVVLMRCPWARSRPAPTARCSRRSRSQYQYARVVEEPDGERKLELNEGHAVHSVYRPGSWLTGDYWDELLVLPFAVRGRAPASVAILGNAAGTTARALGHYFPATRVDGVEIDPELTARPALVRHAQPAAERPRGRCAAVAAADGPPVRRDRRRRLPPALHPVLPTTREFFELARDRLQPGGVVLVNVGHPAGEQQLEQVLGPRCRPSFPPCCAIRARTPTRSWSGARRLDQARSLHEAPARYRSICGRSPGRPRTGSRPRCTAAGSIPTTALRWSG